MPDWDARFAADGLLFGAEPAHGLIRHAELFAPGQSALCVAEGEGRNAIWLAEKGLAVTAWDGSQVALDKARRLAADRGVSVDFQHADAADYVWPKGAFDHVVAIFVQFAAPDLRDAMFAGMGRALRPGGTLLLHGYTPKQLDYRTGGPPDADYLYTEGLLRDRFAGLTILHLESYEADLVEGAGHVGRSALIDLVARRPL